MKPIVISVGGSIINPKTVDKNFLKQLKFLILKFKTRKIVICAGGGFIARDYINALKDQNEYTRDLVGIECTRLNAKLLASHIQKCNQEIPTTLEEVKDMLHSYNLVICGGLRPGTTSDGTSAAIAEYIDASMLINMTNVIGLYTKDPNKHKSAKLIPKLTHKEFKGIIDKVKERPGQHFVLDSLAAKITRNANIQVAILKGITNLEKCIKGQPFKGTKIH
ncbi:MAG: UMP kinase [archaeon]